MRFAFWYFNCLTRSTPLFLRGDLRCKQVAFFILRTEFIIRYLYEQLLALLEAVAWVRPFSSEFSAYSVVM